MGEERRVTKKEVRRVTKVEGRRVTKVETRAIKVEPVPRPVAMLKKANLANHPHLSQAKIRHLSPEKFRHRNQAKVPSQSLAKCRLNPGKHRPSLANHQQTPHQIPCLSRNHKGGKIQRTLPVGPITTLMVGMGVLDQWRSKFRVMTN